jgi:hypothetical protein
MAVSKHPSEKTEAPRRPPATSTTSGGINKETHSGQEGVHYGFRHEVNVKPAHKSERAYDFHYRGGDETKGDHPG